MPNEILRELAGWAATHLETIQAIERYDDVCRRHDELLRERNALQQDWLTQRAELMRASLEAGVPDETLSVLSTLDDTFARNVAEVDAAITELNVPLEAERIRAAKQREIAPLERLVHAYSNLEG